MGGRKKEISGDAAKTIILKAEGVVPSKKNAVRHKFGGGGFYEKGMKREIDWLTMQFRMAYAPRDPLEGSLMVHTEIYRLPASKDNDNMHTTLLDCLQAAGVIKNDKMVRKGSYEGIPVNSVDKCRVVIHICTLS